MLDAETKRRIGVLGRAALSSLAQRSTMLPPPSRLYSNAELSMGLRPRLSAAAASRLYSNPRAGARGLFFEIVAPRRVMVLGRVPCPGLLQAPTGGDMRTPHSRLFGTPGLTPGDIFLPAVSLKARSRGLPLRLYFPRPFP